MNLTRVQLLNPAFSYSRPEDDPVCPWGIYRNGSQLIPDTPGIFHCLEVVVSMLSIIGAQVSFMSCLRCTVLFSLHLCEQKVRSAYAEGGEKPLFCTC